ncbi:hypothetical protein D9756_009463 [Leucocoprinus leucothites]|uniref:Nephrocystin 3-like N-terminal domain-containing protein n=1 Tax=Leucocoprinus leucothites TaxID=201217 RepID=A0A8H5CW98_9AGAR|nr:hypothetical protein D9756_009463 [Leucoagaricus leucothites]
MLSNLNNTQFNNSTFVEYNQGTSGLDILLKHSTKEATHDSYARESKDSCFPGTRTQYIQDITTWTTSADQDRRYRLFWMQGPAGVGKTTIAQSCAEETADYGSLGASFFFSRDNGVVDPSRLFTTIAYQIATHIDQYRRIVEGRIRHDPMLVTKKLETQFKKLIIEPFLELERKGVELRQRTVFIDGLDECEGSTKQLTIVKLVAESIRTYGAQVPFLWAFFSRRESHLAQIFSDPSISPLCWRVELPVSREIDDEIRLYLRGTLRNLPSSASAFNASSDPSEWLSGGDLDKLVELSAGLFIYAVTITKFITDPESLGPKEQLREVLLFHSRLQNRSSRTDNHSNPMALSIV